MTLTIRTFRNTDVEPLCRVWNAHHAELGPELAQNCAIAPLRFELGCLAKPYFEGNDLLVAEVDDEIVGMAHLAQVANETLTDARADAVALAAVCIVPREDDEIIAECLVAEVDEACKRRGVDSFQYKPMLPHNSFYLGSGMGGSMIGLTTAEHRTIGWLTKAGYQPMVPTTGWELDLAAFHPPMDRQQIQIRRSAQVNREVDEPMLPWWQACMLGHTEPTAFQLTHRTEKRVLNEVLFWTVASELQSSRDSVVWLWPPKFETQGTAAEPTPNATTTVQAVTRPNPFGSGTFGVSRRPDPTRGGAGPADEELSRYVFLLSESLRQFQDERIEVARTVSTSADRQLNELLRRLGFVAAESGVVFERRLEA